MPEYPFDVLPPPEGMPPVEFLNTTFRGLPYPWLAWLAIIAGYQAYGADKLVPDYLDWSNKFLRKLAWRELHRRHPSHNQWVDWKTERGPWHYS